MEFNNNQKACIKALLYSDIFNFPLTGEELWRNLIAKNPIGRKTLTRTLKTLPGVIASQNGYYCLKGLEEIIDQRIKREKITDEKLQIAKNVTSYLSFIPTIKFIGLSGRLSHMDADEDDDIDMFFITRKNSVWVTRTLILLILEFLKARRTENDKNPKNKICPNLIIDESALAWPLKKRDIYTAHEIIQLYPLITKGDTYEKFLTSNNWIKQYYPNVTPRPGKLDNMPAQKNYLVLKTISLILTRLPFENILGKLQMIYMRKRVTTEIIRPDFLAFHPQDKHMQIVSAFNTKKWNIFKG